MRERTQRTAPRRRVPPRSRWLPRRALLVLAVALGSCGAPPPDGELEQALFANDQTCFDFFVARGLTNYQAAGIVGNLDQESGTSPTAVQGGGPGRGIAQWSVGGRWDTSHNDNVVWFASTKGLSPWSLQAQLEFIWYELTTFGYGFAQLKAATNVSQATIAFEDFYEICGNCQQASRISYATAVLNAYGSYAWGAKYVSQSWPPASSPLNMVVNQTVAANIVLKNTGTKSWTTSTRLGTTQPRDRKSVFAGADWISPSRPAECKSATGPGGTCKFAFNFHAPNTPGDYKEFFGVVQDGVTWFSANGEGGPPDNQIEAWIHVAEAPYHGQFVAQSYPGVTGGGVVNIPAGSTVQGWMELKNVGTSTWKAGVTKLAPTPRDKPSALAASDWLSATRVSTPKADVPPGQSFKFPLSLHGTTQGQTITQTFTLVEEAVTWFADAPKGGGPPDNLLAVKVVVGAPLPPPDMAGMPVDLGSAAADLAGAVDAGDDGIVPPTDDASTDDADTTGTDDASFVAADDMGSLFTDDAAPEPSDDAGAGPTATPDAAAHGQTVNGGCGCSTSGTSPTGSALSFALVLLALAASRRRYYS